MTVIVDLGDIKSEIHFSQPQQYDIKPALKKALNVEVPGAKYLWAFKSGEWDGTVDLWAEGQSLTNGNVGLSYQIRTGLIPRVITELEKIAPVQIGWDTRYCKIHPVAVYQQTQVPLRDYQRDAMEKALQNYAQTRTFRTWWPRGVVEVATGGGKTEIAVAMYETNPVPTFFLVHRKDLLIQAAERFEKYGHRPGILGGGEWKPSSQLNIATMQTVHKVLFGQEMGPKFEALAYLSQHCRQIFVDECHLAASSLDKGNEFVKVIDAFQGATYRWGLTATPFMRNTYDNMLLEGVTGTSIVQITSGQLINLGFLTKPKVIMKKVPGQLLAKMDWKKAKSTAARAEHWRTVEDKGIKFNQIRTDIMIQEIMKGPFPCLVLVKTIDQAMFINTLYQNRTGYPLPFLSGSDSATDRRAGVKGLNDGTIPVLMATTIFDEGVDVPALAKVILASGGKSQVKLIQRVGRALRIHQGKQEAIIVDFADEHHSMLKAHAEERRKVWEDQSYEVVEE